MDEKVFEVLSDIKITLAKLTTIMDEHIRRTKLAEDNIEMLREDLAPIKQHVALWGSLAKIIGFGGTLVGLAAGVLHLIGK